MFEFVLDWFTCLLFGSRNGRRNHAILLANDLRSFSDFVGGLDHNKDCCPEGKLDGSYGQRFMGGYRRIVKV